MSANVTMSNVPQALPRMTQSGAETFRKAVNYVFTNWPALEAAIENGMGGSQAREKRSWICKTIADVVLEQKDIELEDYLEQMIDQEFDTYIEDGSIEYNLKWIRKFYKDCLDGKEQEVINSLNEASRKKLSLSNMNIPKPVVQTQESTDDDEDEDE